MQEKKCNRCNKIKSVNDFYVCKRYKLGIHTECKSCLINRRKHQKPPVKTKLWLCNQIYKGQLYASKKRHHKPPLYTYKELEEWIFKQSNFKSLYDYWVKSGYNKDLIPSVDRKDDYKGYSLENIQLMTWKENITKAHEDCKNGINNKRSKAVLQFDTRGVFVNEYKSINDASRKTNVLVCNISLACNNRRNTAGNFIWKLKSTQDNTNES